MHPADPAFAVKDGSGGGTRTPDTRIMIVHAFIYKPLKSLTCSIRHVANTCNTIASSYNELRAVAALTRNKSATWLVNHSLGRDVTAGYIQFGPERLRKPMQRVSDRLKQLIGVTGPEGENVEKMKR